jgi:hypothetical protein
MPPFASAHRLTQVEGFVRYKFFEMFNSYGTHFVDELVLGGKVVYSKKISKSASAGCWSLAAGRWPLAAGPWPLAAGRWLLAADCCAAADGGVDARRVVAYGHDRFNRQGALCRTRRQRTAVFGVQRRRHRRLRASVRKYESSGGEQLPERLRVVHVRHTCHAHMPRRYAPPRRCSLLSTAQLLHMLRAGALSLVAVATARDHTGVWRPLATVRVVASCVAAALHLPSCCGM